MANLSNEPVALKGALVAFRLPNPNPQVISFQYNPQTLSRTLEVQSQASGDGGLGDVFRLTGAPVETIKLDAEIDAVDQLDAGSDIAAEMGIHPQLAALELLLYPTVAHVVTNSVLLSLGTIEVIPAQSPFVLLVWGPKRVVPVRISEFSVTEEMFDTRLNPIRAKVSLGLRVLSYNDLSRTHPGYSIFLAHQATKEAMARLAPGTTLSSVTGGASLGV
ncbi:hypothetical protein F183_A33490 [Bryobacterales bacterium F-183]|nr:hypothetical protein F183_A33490 [Bryobacterales bacterium F-183]